MDEELRDFIKSKAKPYEPYTRAQQDQEIIQICPNCGEEFIMYRERGHQHFRPLSSKLIEWDRVVYLQCGECGELIRTRLKPMSKSMPEDMARNWGLIP